MIQVNFFQIIATNCSFENGYRAPIFDLATLQHETIYVGAHREIWWHSFRPLVTDWLAIHANLILLSLHHLLDVTLNGGHELFVEWVVVLDVSSTSCDNFILWLSLVAEKSFIGNG